LWVGGKGRSRWRGGVQQWGAVGVDGEDLAKPFLVLFRGEWSGLDRGRELVFDAAFAQGDAALVEFLIAQFEGEAQEGLGIDEAGVG
jgi:hypothetical protein